MTYLELISSSIHTFTELTLVNTFLRVWMDTWTENRKQKTENSKVKWEKLAYTHETDNFVINYSWVYMIGHWCLYRRNWPSLPSPKKEIRSSQYRRSTRNLRFPQLLAASMKNKFSPLKFLAPIFVGGVGSISYTMENKVTKRDYQKGVRLGDQKWEIVEITFGITFLFEICIHFFYTGSFLDPPKKNHPHLKWQLPPKILIWPKSLLCKPSEKWVRTMFNFAFPWNYFNV